jgi:hypothetical protein
MLNADQVVGRPRQAVSRRGRGLDGAGYEHRE